jgi:hypothetical protein
LFPYENCNIFFLKKIVTFCFLKKTVTFCFLKKIVTFRVLKKIRLDNAEGVGQVERETEIGKKNRMMNNIKRHEKRGYGRRKSKNAEKKRMRQTVPACEKAATKRVCICLPVKRPKQNVYVFACL